MRGVSILPAIVATLTHLGPGQATYLPPVTARAAPARTATSTPTVSPTSTPTPTPGPWDCTYDRYDCTDFSSRDEAQACHNYCMALVGYDVHHLDGDDDGIACEMLP
jgi:hypothetical protein